VYLKHHGHLIASPKQIGNEIRIRWRAEVPWEWPSYASLNEKYNDPHAESFPIPNASCLFFGIEGAITIDNGLGEYITRLDLAKPFLAYAVWPEVVQE
jgi:hypothetical protein